MKTHFSTALLFCLGLVVLPGSMARAQSTPVSLPDQPAKMGLSLESELIASGDAALKGDDTKYRHVTLYHGSWALSQTVPLKNKSNLVFGFGYSLSGYDVSEPDGWKDDDFWKEYKNTHPNWNEIPLPNRLQSLTASLEYSREINDRWSFSTSVATGSYVTSTGLLSDGWGSNASVMALYKWSPTVTLAMGAAYDSLSHDYQFVPVFGFDWRLSEKWAVAIGFPSTAVTYQFNRKLSMALAISGTGGTYYVRDDPMPGVAPRSLAGSKLETTEVRLGLKVDWKINDTFAINATSGHVLYREFKYIDRGFKLKSRNVVPFFSLGGSVSL